MIDKFDIERLFLYSFISGTMMIFAIWRVCDGEYAMGALLLVFAIVDLGISFRIKKEMEVW